MSGAPNQEQDEFPWWLVAVTLIGVVLAILIAANGLYHQLFTTVVKGVWTTLFVTIIAFFLSCLMGLSLATFGLSRFKFLRQITRFYVEVIRGIPMLVLLFYIAFVGAPAIVATWNFISAPLQKIGLIEPMIIRDFPLMWRAIVALMIGYSAFLSEVFRAGIQAVDKGQIEAAKSLGLSGWQRFRFVIFPQAIRTILPPLGNDFIAMVKDSSLVSVLGVSDITQLGKVYASGSFRFFETYSIVAYIYLVMTIGLSLALRNLEKRMRKGDVR
jgi:polar amino acid transport system permease protein